MASRYQGIKGLRADAASCGSHFVVQTRSFDAGILPAASVDVRTLAGLLYAALRAAGWRGSRPHPAGSCVAQRTNAPPASVPAELADRTTDRIGAPITVGEGVSGSSMRESGTRPTMTCARGRDPVQIEGSRARMPGSRVVHRARTGGGRMPPVTRNSGGPQGRHKTSWSVRPSQSEPAGCRRRMSVSGLRSASRRTRRRRARARTRGTDT